MKVVLAGVRSAAGAVEEELGRLEANGVPEGCEGRMERAQDHLDMALVHLEGAAESLALARDGVKPEKVERSVGGTKGAGKPKPVESGQAGQDPPHDPDLEFQVAQDWLANRTPEQRAAFRAAFLEVGPEKFVADHPELGEHAQAFYDLVTAEPSSENGGAGDSAGAQGPVETGSSPADKGVSPVDAPQGSGAGSSSSGAGKASTSSSAKKKPAAAPKKGGGKKAAAKTSPPG